MLRRTLLASAAALATLGTATLAQDGEPLKVGFVYVGSIGDGGWTYCSPPDSRFPMAVGYVTVGA